MHHTGSTDTSLHRLCNIADREIGMLMGLIRGMGVMAGYPALILLPMAALVALAWLSRSRIATGVAIAWAVYLVYETMRYFEILCIGDCHMRLELAVIYPLLLLGSVVAMVAAVVNSASRILRRQG
jgi:hypothetical protein